MNNVLQDNNLKLNWWGHDMSGKDKPTLDDEGDLSSYAKCIKCGAVENTDQSIQICPKAEYIHISVCASQLQLKVEEALDLFAEHLLTLKDGTHDIHKEAKSFSKSWATLHKKI